MFIYRFMRGSCRKGLWEAWRLTRWLGDASILSSELRQLGTADARSWKLGRPGKVQV